MLAHLNLQVETMEQHGNIIDKLDELVYLATLRTVAHDKFAESQIENRRLADEPQTAYFYIAASFIAQRACHTAQAGALLLRHGFADQAFELWRTMFNLDAVLQNLCSEDREIRAERYLSAAAPEMMFLDKEAEELGIDYARLVADSLQENVDQLRSKMMAAYDQGILAKDGWIMPGSEHDLKSLAQEAGIINWYPMYQIAGKLHHGAPISTFIRASARPMESWDPLRHSTEGVPVQSLLTAQFLHGIVSAFCDSTDEIPIYEDDQWFEKSEALLAELTEIFVSGPAKKEFSVIPNDSGLAAGMDDPGALKQLLEDEDIEHYLRVRDREA